ncbi:MAG: IclR family transcriptional regulator [Acidobacteria bacterium]|nr:IclR family transcriptional regulator [Acidobacteriota bacterium]
MNQRQSSRNYEVAAVRKALEILCEFSGGTATLAVSDISRRLEIPKSTAHNLLRTLQTYDFIQQDAIDRRYRLGPRVFELGLLFSQNTELIAKARPHLLRLAEATRETVKLGILSSGGALILSAIESPFALHTRGDEGRRAPLHCTSIGKSLLAALPDEEIGEIVAVRSLARLSPHTITTSEGLLEEIGRVREQGYAFDSEENELGVRCVGALIPGTGRSAAAGVSVSGPSSRISEERLLELAALVRETAASIAASLTAPVSTRTRFRRASSGA